MFKWFNKWFAKQCEKAWESSKEPVILNIPSDTLQSPNNFKTLQGNSITFHIFNANGGFVIQHYLNSNVISREQSPGLTIVTRGEDLGQVISHIVTLEALRN
jgi:hypothetical protein